MQHVEAALPRAAAKAFDLGKKTHTPVFIWRDGKIVDLTKEANNPPATPSIDPQQ